MLALVACASAPPVAPVAATCPPAPTPPPPFSLDDNTDRTLYALGLLMGQRMGDFALSASELEVVQHGIADQVLGTRPLVPLRAWGPRINELAAERRADRARTEQRVGAVYAERMAAEPGARRLPSGLVFRELRAGNGTRPGPNDTVRADYRGTLVDGLEFDSTYSEDGGTEPAEFPLPGVVPCWQEALQLMSVGSRAQLVCPSTIAYGERGQRAIPPGATLTFEVELVGVVPAPAPAPEPAPEPTPTPPPTTARPRVVRPR
jgi:FKBP-type peptidyl-prolyl cis-trans isomerase FkpA